jgi:predicted LPLAT superfamily acyltransferase
MRAAWRERPEGGGRTALRLIAGFALRFGRAPARLALYPITAYFLLRRGPERRASRAYLSRVLERPSGLWDVARHIRTFACTTLDRVFLLSERFRRFDIRIHGVAELDRLLAQGRGVLLFGAHLGSFDALRVLSLERPDVTVRIVLDIEHGPALTSLLGALNPALAANIINPRGSGPEVALAIKSALDRNAIVAMPVDRAKPGDAVVHAQFLRHPAPFPTAPWLLAAAVQAPVVVSFGLYRGGKRYDLHFETFSEGLTIERRERQAAAAALVQRFADRLANYARLAPYNWFNFYDFWQDKTLARETRAADAAARGGLVRRS